MMPIVSLSYQLFLMMILFAIDRISKYWAITQCIERVDITQFMACESVSNRGISWGLLHEPTGPNFVIITAIISLVTCAIGWVAYRRWQQRKPIIGELLIITGSFSNIIDRFHYDGVIDFIELFYGGWMFPVFNCADVWIVVGVGILLLCSAYDDK
jgi:signal peptidase II